MILDTLSRTPGLITPFDKEYNQIQERSTRKDVTRAPEHDREAVPIARDASRYLSDPTLSRPRNYPVPSDPSTDLRALIPSSKVLTVEDGDEYMPSALTSNLLYARKAPRIVVVANNVQDIQQTIKFARKRHIPLTVQNGGHSYGGYALNHEGILINLKPFKDVKVNLNSTPKQATIQAGCQWIDVYDHFKANGYKQMVLGGRCKQVGVSGYTLGGGVSPFSRHYGLGIDSILEMKVITASGDLVTVSSKDTDPKKKELFWALRGGGGGNFGILTEFTTQIHDLVDRAGEVIYGVLVWELPRQKSEFNAMIEVLNSTTWPNELTMDLLWQQTKDSPSTGGLVVVYDGTMEDYRKAIRPLARFIHGESPVRKCNWWDVSVIEQGWYAESPAFHHHTSFVFARGSLTLKVINEVDNLMQETRKRLDRCDPHGKAYIIWVQVGGKVNRVRAEDTAYYWRDAEYVSYFKLQWYKREAMGEMIKLVEEVKEKLLPYTIQGKAAYVNFVDRTISNWQDAYYGKNYSRLQRVKKEWDPDNFFKFEQSIDLPGTTGPRAGTGEDLRKALRQTEVVWGQYALRHPEKIWNLPGPLPKEEDVLRIIREELEF
ncbi:FAD-binding domain protein [Rhizoctonia solani AG-3 Rhs1AP]|uniref:FAD-binding domain protein n=1 Tax=Rhizoctonia solani AG-3 Rhs1AP TaxID=1086054 RepID=X8IVD4_9AGAM|nr:FAD-binding domain protein [Rhizoctonia solani AG-3 Rhs1AP]